MKPLLILIIEVLFVIFYTIGFIGMVNIFSASDDGRYTYIQSLVKNWKTGPVINLFSGQACNSSLINDAWPGTVKMCSKYGTMKRDSCAKGSKRYTPISPVTYTRWRDTNLCAERLQTNYLDLSIAQKEDKCPVGFRSCGVIDTMKNVMCVSKLSKCPYNYIEMTTPGSPLPTDFNYTSIPVKGKNLLAGFSQNGKVVNEFIVSEDTPCADPYYKNYLGNLYFAEVHYNGREKCRDQIAGDLFDQRTELKDVYSYYDVYNENGILNLMSKYPSFPDYSASLKTSQRTLKLFHRSYIGLNKQCLDEIRQLGLGSKIISDLERLSENMDGWYTASLVCLIFSCFGLAAYYLYLTFVFTFICQGKLTDDDKLKARTSMHSMINASALIYFIFACVLYSYISGLETSYAYLSEFNCADEMTTQAILQAENTRSSFKVSVVFMLISGSLTILLNLVSYYFTFIF